MDGHVAAESHQNAERKAKKRKGTDVPKTYGVNINEIKEEHYNYYTTKNLNRQQIQLMFRM